MNKYIVCKNCLQTNKYPQVLAMIDDYGILNIKRVNKCSTMIGGAQMTLTCDRCGASIVLEIKRKQLIPQKIMGTISVEETGFKYYFT